MLTFFRAYIGGETQFVPYLKGELPPPPSAQGALLQFTDHAPSDARLDVNRFLTPDALTTDALGGAVREAGLTPFDVQGSGVAPEGKSPIPGQPAARQPANTPSLYAPKAPGLSQLRLGWSAPGAFLEGRHPPPGSATSAASPACNSAPPSTSWTTATRWPRTTSPWS